LSQKRTHPGDDSHHIGRGEQQNGSLLRFIRAGRIEFGIFCNSPGYGFVHSNSHLASLIENDRITMYESKRRHRLATVCTPDRFRTSTFNPSFRVYCVAVGTFGSDIGIAQKVSINHFIMARSRRYRSDSYITDADRHCISRLSAFNCHRLSYFMATLD